MYSGNSKVYVKRNVALTFEKEEEAIGEVNYLGFSDKPIKVCCYKNGKSYVVTRRLSLEMVLTLIAGGYKDRLKGEKECQT